MTAVAPEDRNAQMWNTLEPFAQLFRAMLPRAANFAVFNAAGQLCWSSDATLGPDLITRVAAKLPVARDPASGDGVVEMLGEQPAYLFWLRRDDSTLLAVVAVLTRPAANDAESRAFS